MRRGITTLILLILLATPLILAEDNITDQAQEGLSTLRGGLDLKTENVLEKEISIPKAIQIPSKLIFGIETGITWQQLIIVLGIWIGAFIVILNIAGLMPFFGEGTLKVAASIIITALVSITGALNVAATFFFDIAGFFKWTGSWGPLRMIIAILIAAAIIFAINWYVHKMKTKGRLRAAKRISRDVQTVAKLNRRQVRQELNQ